MYHLTISKTERFLKLLQYWLHSTSLYRRHCCSNALKKVNINFTLTVILIIAAWTRKSWLLKTWMAITSICAFSDLRSVLFDLMVRTNKQLHTLRFQMKIFLDPICTFSPYYLFSLSKGLIIVGPKLLRPMPSNFWCLFFGYSWYESKSQFSNLP